MQISNLTDFYNNNPYLPMSIYDIEQERGQVKKEFSNNDVTLDRQEYSYVSLMICVIEDIYEFANPKEIKNFLLNYNFVYNPLIEIYKTIKEIFADNLVNVKLEYLSDPDERNFENLFVKIKTKLSFNESLNLLDNFDEYYWLDVENKIRNIIEVTID